MKALFQLMTAIPALLAGTPSGAQIKNVKTETVAVNGNCDMCRKTIETTAYSKKVSEAVWNKDSKTATLRFDSSKTTADAILKKIALAGYDNQNYLAPDAAYAKLSACCQYPRKQATAAAPQGSHEGMTSHDHAGMQHAAATGQVVAAAVYDAYFALKDALVKSDGAAASAKAAVLAEAVNALPMDKLSPTQHTVWMKYNTELASQAALIKGAKDLAKQRDAFSKLSAAMYEVVKAIKPGYPVYFDHCPMYNDGKGADWLSRESGIKNPYYGAQMLSCGSTRETIQ